MNADPRADHETDRSAGPEADHRGGSVLPHVRMARSDAPDDAHIEADAPVVVSTLAGAKHAREVVDQPGTLIRIASVAEHLLRELREGELDRAARDRMREAHNSLIRRLEDILSEDLRNEMSAMSLSLTDESHLPTPSELRVAEAQLVGWLEGLLHGIQISIVGGTAVREDEEDDRPEPPWRRTGRDPSYL